MRTSEHFDGLGERAIGRHRAVLMAVGTHQIGQHPGIAGIALGA